MGVRGQLSGFPPPIIGSLVGTIPSRRTRSRAKLVRPAGRRSPATEPDAPVTRKLRPLTDGYISCPSPQWYISDAAATMGCTSSAQNMAPSLTNSERYQDTLEEINENQVEDNTEAAFEKSSEANAIKVLTTCDNLDEPTHLDSHSKLVDTGNPDFGQDHHVNGHSTESENANTVINTRNLNFDTNESDDRLSHLEEVVEKVVELYENGELEIPAESRHSSDENIQTNLSQKDKDTNMDANQDNLKDTNHTKDVETAEAASPSQSECSRATRWEALADVAAELPPSLAVDPVTGQIYALSK